VSELIPGPDWSKAEARLGKATRGRRADRGRARLPAAVEKQLQRRLATAERPEFSALARELADYCRKRGLRVPARSSIYNAVARAAVPLFPWAELPPTITAALYNLSSEAGHAVPGDQLVFYALNYGSPHAISYAAGLPWLCLQRASERRGWRPKSRALLGAIMAFRGI
jgi:hypothetical protein